MYRAKSYYFRFGVFTLSLFYFIILLFIFHCFFIFIDSGPFEPDGGNIQSKPVLSETVWFFLTLRHRYRLLSDSRLNEIYIYDSGTLGIQISTGQY
jgi:hypothetical protein